MNNYKIIIYNDEEMHYMEGYMVSMNSAPQVESYDVGYEKRYVPVKREFTFGASVEPDTETIKLDPTLMKRIAKYNKEKEIEKLEEKIKRKQEKLKELESKVEDREKRWKKVQEYVTKIYEIDLDEDLYEEEDWDE